MNARLASRPALARRRGVLILVLALAAWTLSAPPTRTASADSNEGDRPALVDAQRLVSAGGLHTCAVMDSGVVRCWGANANGELGNGRRAVTTTPGPVNGIANATAVSAGNTHSCAVLADATVRCWGLNGNGQLGHGDEFAVDSLEPVVVTGLDDALSVASGGFHSCAVRRGGAVACWGNDGLGQLGDGENPASAPGRAITPVAVSGVTDGVALALGEFHACALHAAGGVSCWGHNGFGQLGNGTTHDSITPVAVVGLPDPQTRPALAITAGSSHTCVVVADDDPDPAVEQNSVWCWGNNAHGQLGDGTITHRATPVRAQHDVNPDVTVYEFEDFLGATAVSAGQFHTCSRRSDGQAFCWGAAARGQMGNGTKGDTNPFLPDEGAGSELRQMWRSAVPVSLGPVTAITGGGFHTCATTASGMSCWGYNFYGQLGGYEAQRVVPVTVTALQGAASVATGTDHVCARVENTDSPPKHRAVCWGANGAGQLGAGLPVPNSTVAVDVTGLPDVDAIVAGNGHLCALPRQSTSPACWGRNGDGQLGDGSTANASTPVPVGGLSTATQLDAQGFDVFGVQRGQTCARLTDGTARCWGNNQAGQLGDGTTTSSGSPVVVQFDSDPEPPEPGDDHYAPLPLPGIAAVTVGSAHGCALRTDTSVWCWGANGAGQLGDNTTDSRPLAEPVLLEDHPDPDPDVPLTGVQAVAAGAAHTCAIMSTGRVKCWGANHSRQLGDGTTVQRNLPVNVINIPEAFRPELVAVAISAGDHHNCVTVANASARCWGANGFGQLGNNSTADSSIPVVPFTLDNAAADTIRSNVPAGQPRDLVTSLSAGRANTCASLIDKTVSCWGRNNAGQLGDGVGPTQLLPRSVLNLVEGLGNRSPEAVADVAATPEDTAVAIGVTTNDTDPDGDPLSVLLTGAPGHGTAVPAGGSVTYTPAPDYCGPDSFFYRVFDGRNGVSEAAVAVTVSCVNDDPVAADDSATADEDGTTVVDVLANDTDADGDPMVITVFSAGGSGTTSEESGKVRYTPDPDFCGADLFVYQVEDGQGGTDTGTVGVTVTCVNDAPVAADDPATTDEDTAVAVDVLANDSDPDGDPLTVTGVTTPQHGTAAFTPGGVTYTPGADFCSAPSDTFGYTVGDGQGGSAGAVVTVQVNCVNDPPVAVDDAATTPESTPVLVDVLANDSDVEGPVSLSSVGMASHGVAVLDAGQIRYTPAPGFCSGPVDAFGYTINDADGASASATLTVTVDCVDDPPSANPDAAGTDEDTAVLLDVLANDSDQEGPVTLTGVGTPSHGTASIQGTEVRYTPAPDFCSTTPDTFTYTISDSGGQTGSAAVEVTVGCVNDAPVVQPVADRTTGWGQEISVAIVASDVDGDPLTFTLVGGPGSVDAGTGVFGWTPTSADVGSHPVTVDVTDPGGLAAQVSFTITVVKGNTKLVYTGPGAGTYTDSVTVSGLLTDTGGTPLPGQQVSFSAAGRNAVAVTGPDGVASADLGPLPAPTAAQMVVEFAGSGGYTGSSTTAPFTVTPEKAATTFTGDYLTVTTDTHVPVRLSAVVVEDQDGALGTDLGSATVTFSLVTGTGTLCSAPVVVTGPGVGSASCMTGALGLGARAFSVALTSGSYAGPVDVSVLTLAQSPKNSAAGGGRIDSGGVRNDFGFDARPGSSKAPPPGGAIHVWRDATHAFVVRSASLTSLVRSCSGSKTAKVCSATVQGGSATTTRVDLATGARTTLPGTSTIRVDADDAASGADRYAVTVSGGTTFALGTAVAKVPLDTGDIRVPG